MGSSSSKSASLSYSKSSPSYLKSSPSYSTLISLSSTPSSSSKSSCPSSTMSRKQKVSEQPVIIQVLARGADIVNRINSGKQPCPGCQKSDGLSFTREGALYIIKRDDLRTKMRKAIQNMMNNASNDKMNGKVYIVYEIIPDLRWISIGEGESGRGLKHWRLVIQLGFDWLTLEYVQDSVFTFHGLVVVGPFDPEATSAAKLYHVGDLKGLNTEELFKWIQDEFYSKEEYNVFTNNCQHFVHNFVAEFEDSGRLSRTGHLEAPTNRRQLITERGRKMRRYAFDKFTYLHMKAFGHLVGAASRTIKSASESDHKS
ncbi:hypothetical protein EC957_001244 [Mortierella hygrophila]|uniref:PPPDE domain-containing protein n=1 Tax=Mortierella hygrophila TaxID=979708 RepID=A0A9P6K2U0_9FUNG|nr:hypothetical protein EC957_001244 [Mortierella hygrophila]